MEIMVTITNEGEKTRILLQLISPPKDKMEEVFALLFTLSGEAGSALFKTGNERELGRLFRRGIELRPSMESGVEIFAELLKELKNRKGSLPKFSLN